MQNVVTCFGRPQAETLKSWRTMSSREFFDGDLTLDGDTPPSFCFDRAIGSPIAVTRLRCDADIGYRRSWQHIRNNKVGVRLIWFIRHGSLRIMRSQGACTVQTEEVAIMDSSVPFHARIICDPEHGFDAYQAIVPPDQFLSHMPEADGMLEPFGLNSPEGHATRALLDLLASDGDQLNQRVVENLSDSLLEALSETVRLKQHTAPRRQRIVDKRLADIENYILMNITDPNLCYNKVAAKCGISPRYLCYLLKANNLSFSEMLWKNRLPRARDCLISSAARDYPIHEIAFMSGFKSAAHFSRMFKAAYGCPPREYRASRNSSSNGPATSPHPEPLLPCDVFQHAA